MIKISIPKKYIEIFKHNEDEIDEIIFNIEGGSVSVSREFIKSFNKKEFDSFEEKEDLLKRVFIPESWFIETKIEDSFEYFKEIKTWLKEEIKEDSLLELTTKTNGTYFFYKENQNRYLEIDQQNMKARENIQERMKNLTDKYGFISIHLISNDMLEEVTVYFTYIKNWKEKENSTGGSNITGFLSESQVEKLRRENGLTEYIKTPLTSYRIKLK